MRNAQSAREALNAAMKFKSQGVFGVFILKYCGGREPQEFAAQARINMKRVDMAKAKIAEKLQVVQRRAEAAANREKRESDLAAQREREERERAEARSETAGLAAACAEELVRRANLRQVEADSRYAAEFLYKTNREIRRTLDEQEQRAEEPGAAAATSLRRLRSEYMKNSSSKEGKNPYGLPLQPKREPPHKQPPQPRGSAGGVFPTQYSTPPPKRSPASRNESRTNVIGEHGLRWRGQPPPPKRPSSQMSVDPDASEVPQPAETPRPPFSDSTSLVSCRRCCGGEYCTQAGEGGSKVCRRVGAAILALGSGACAYLIDLNAQALGSPKPKPPC